MHIKSSLALALGACSALTLASSSHTHGDQALHRRMAKSRRAQAIEKRAAAAQLQRRDNVESTPSGWFNGTALWFEESGSTGACGYVDTNEDYVVGLSDEFWNDFSQMSPLCNEYVYIVNTDNGNNITAKIRDASGKKYTTLTTSAWSALEPNLDIGMIPISYTFLGSNVTIESSAVAAPSSSSTEESAVNRVAAHAEITSSSPSSSADAVTTTAAPASTPSPSYDSASASEASVAAAAASSEAAQAWESSQQAMAAAAAAESSSSADAAAAAAAAAASSSSAEAAAWSSSQAAAAAAASSSSEAAAAAAWSSSKAAEEAAASASSEAAAAAAASSSSEAAAAAAASSKAAEEEASSSSSSSSGGNYNEYTGGYATYFYQNGNPGHCGNYNQDSLPLVALPTNTYAGGSHCGQTVCITRVSTGKTIKALVQDSCPTCVNDACLDLSVGAFTQIASESEGMVDITWSFC